MKCENLIKLLSPWIKSDKSKVGVGVGMLPNIMSVSQFQPLVICCRHLLGMLVFSKKVLSKNSHAEKNLMGLLNVQKNRHIAKHWDID
jgi:hypothetical protein